MSLGCKVQLYECIPNLARARLPLHLSLVAPWHHPVDPTRQLVAAVPSLSLGNYCWVMVHRTVVVVMDIEAEQEALCRPGGSHHMADYFEHQYASHKDLRERPRQSY